MDRYNQVKVLLKNWEQEFVRTHQKKPNKDDIDQAPEETRKLYKEYRNLKQAKEKGRNEEVCGNTDLSRCTAENPAKTEPECWGSHLNRSAQPAPSPRLSSQDRDNLKASAQYYGLKLKSNLASLGKERPATLRKSSLPARAPLNSLKAAQPEHPCSPFTPPVKSAASECNPLTPSDVKAHHGSAASATPEPLEPENHFEPFKPFIESCEDPKNLDPSHCLSKCNSIKLIDSQNQNTSGLLTPSKSTPLSSSSLDKVGLAGQDVVSKETPKALGGFRGGMGCSGSRPSPASRLSVIDKKWLERCQVFGEMEADVRPGAGNQEIVVKERDDGEIQANTQDRCAEKEAIINRKEQTGKIQGPNTQGENICEIGGEQLRETSTSPLADGEKKQNDKPKSGKRGGKKRQREEENREGSPSEEGGVKKRRKNAKSKEGTTGGEPGTSGAGGKKRKAKEKDENSQNDADGDIKVPKMTQKENLLGEFEEEYSARKISSQPVKARNRGAEGNFVKINLKKKSHVKGYALRGVGLRKQMYMQKFQLKGERFGGGGGYFGRGRRGGFRGSLSRQGDTCYKCGATGHWAINCPGRAPPPPSVPDDPPVDEESFELPTLEEVARLTGTLRTQSLDPPTDNSEGRSHKEKDLDVSKRDEVLLNVIRPDYERPPAPPPMEPLFGLAGDGKVRETPPEVLAALRELGYQSFRPGQEEAIMRILSGLSTLVVLSTGMGKSLCYQLPAYMYAQRSKSITLVISPLVSLMDDQLSGLPANLKAACIHSNMTMKQREAAIEKVKSGQVCVLLLSPEALVGGGGGGSGAGCLPSAQELPPVAFACIDEAHCVSEWSHNFRPCYLRLCKVLRERLGVRCLLGLTATATLSTALDIAQHLDITDQDGIAVRSAAVPSNLHLSVSMDREKDQALVPLLKGDRFGCLDSIIVYCTRREETVRVAALLRTCLQGVLLKENKNVSSSQTQNNPVGQRKKELARKKIRKPLKWQAEAYHAGLSASERRRVQNNFMCGELRIVVATVAFGMGLDKSDVRGIIHYNMPKSFESYVQEIGRAGRDGEPAHCHLFLDPEGGDLHELRRHIYADTVDYYTVKKLVQKVFPACKCKQIHQKQQELAQEVEDAELLEMMDACDEEDSVTALPPPNDAHLTEPPTPPETTNREEEKEEEGEEMAREKEQALQHDKEDGGLRRNEEEKDGGDLLRKGEKEDFQWPRERVCHTHERAIPIQETVETLDITEEGVETLLCYLELHPQRFVELLHPTLSVCKISCYDGPKQLQRTTKICPPVAVVLARRRMAGEQVETCDQVEFDVVEVADTMGWQLALVKRGLRQLQWSTRKAGGRSGVHVEFSSLSFYFRSCGDLSDEEMDRVCHFLHNRVQNQERTQLYQLTACFTAFKSVGFCSVSSCVDDLDESRSLELKRLLAEYFDKRRDRSHVYAPQEVEELAKYKLSDWEEQIRADVRSFLATRSDEKFSGRAVARILHGIGSPCYPAQTYGRDRRYWRKYIHFDFNQLIKLATHEIIRFK